MQFRIKDQDYFLTFGEEEQRWYLVAATATGLQRIPVYVDAVKFERFGGRENSAAPSRN